MTRYRRARHGLPELLGLGLLAALVAGCGGDEEVDVASPDILAPDASQVMVGVQHYMTRDGVRKADLRADTAVFLRDESGVALRGVEVTFFGDLGRMASELTAERGMYDLAVGDMRAEGNVVVVDSTGTRRLETEALRYRAVADELSSDVPFVYHRDGDVIRGTGFVTDPGLRNIRIEEPSGESPHAREPG